MSWGIIGRGQETPWSEAAIDHLIQEQAKGGLYSFREPKGNSESSPPWPTQPKNR